MKAKPEIMKLAEFLDMFNSESDRGAALLAGSMMEEVLGEILQSYFIEEEATSQLLNGFNAPLGTLNSRILAAYALGLIEKDEFTEAETIRRIRNEFGHNWKDVSFDGGRVAGLASNLPWRGPEDEKSIATSRARFNTAVCMLMGDWLWRKRMVLKERRELKSWPYKAGTDRFD